MLTALTKVTAWVDEPQFTSRERRRDIYIRVAKYTYERFAHTRRSAYACAVLTGLLDGDVYVEEDLDAVGEQRGPPVDDKHDDATEHRPHQRQPHVVEPVRRTPSCRGDHAENVKRNFVASCGFLILQRYSLVTAVSFLPRQMERFRT